MKYKTLFFFTSSFPFGNGETFIEEEIKCLCQQFERVLIFPMINKLDRKRSIPENATVVSLDFQNLTDVKMSGSLLFKLLKSDITNEGLLFKDFRYFLSYTKNIVLKTVVFQSWLESSSYSNFTCYSYWFDEWATVLSLSVDGKVIPTFISRTHGFDLFEERQAHGKIPFRNYQLTKTNKIFSVSKAGLNYLQIKYPVWKSKIDYVYLGTSDYGFNENPAKEGVYNLVSCSNLIPLKRVHLIVDILRIIGLKINWTHFGDGPLLDELIASSKNLPDDIQVSFRGHVSNEEVIDFYRNNFIDLFINVSDTEGLPVSIMEAISFGIPVIGTDVGGVGEIVNEKSGLLLKPNFDINFVAKEISQFISLKSRDFSFRREVRKYWLNEFNSKKNYLKFINKISKLIKN